MTPQLWGVFLGFFVGFIMMRVHRVQALKARNSGDGSTAAMLNALATVSPLIWAGIGGLIVPFLIPEAT